MTSYSNVLRFDGFSSDGQFSSFTESDSNWAQRVYLDIPGNDYRLGPIRVQGKNALFGLDSTLSKYDDTFGIKSGNRGVNLPLVSTSDSCKSFKANGRWYSLCLRYDSNKFVLFVKDSLSNRVVVFQNNQKMLLWPQKVTGYNIFETWFNNGQLIIIFIKVIIPVGIKYLAISGQLPNLPISQDTIINKIIDTMKLFSVKDTNEPWWGRSHGEFILDSYSRSIDTQQVILRPMKHKKDRTWTFSIQRRDYPTEVETKRAMDSILSVIPNVSLSKTQYVPRLAWCWVSVIFASRKIYVVSTWCSGSPTQHFIASNILFNTVSIPTDGIYGIIGLHSGWTQVVRKLPFTIAQ